jgi:N-formylglutamate amidohydrolase
LTGCTDSGETHITVNLAMHSVDDWQENIELMLHELAHSVVKSNDHLVHEFYETMGRLGAKLSLLAVENPELFEGVTEMVAE